ncbi:dihydrodipicolinate synthase family protein [Streptomyces sp. NBC_01239]|uniref:dihydrodipicolinate synthase family protein n=1 Tax=Streptomyces sp. NBC_01239 TaxID=2903792 RepID=UPI00224DD2F2|nr:dihydrodipicolinate synthase family protein [Streptomyces sp. NBC_01239]MCX4817971.1 dihydrodipicolinate synthase family protein [Streptomyces sp. NBC_01239]
MSISFGKAEARDWAWEHFQGVNNVVIPSFSADMTRLNESGIRHDIRRVIELGFTGTLLVGEVNITPDEYNRFVEIAADEAAGRLNLIFHCAFNTLEENITAARRAQAAGANLALLSYPPNFYPTSQQEIFEYSKAFCDAVDLGVILFPMTHWGFERLHPASISVDVLNSMVDDFPNVVSIKAEGGFPSVAGFAHAWTRLGERVLITMPIIQEAIALATLVPLRVIATSNTEYYSDTAPRMLALARDGKTDEALDLLWKIAPAWRANSNVAPLPHGHTVNRAAWKYQAWLAGFNGGPMRVPGTRLHSGEMQAYRRALHASGLPVTDDPDEAYFVGRFPE